LRLRPAAPDARDAGAHLLAWNGEGHEDHAPFVPCESGATVSDADNLQFKFQAGFHGKDDGR
jgi:hypothetical protein